MVEILLKGLKVAPELAMMQDKEHKSLLDKGSRFFLEASKQAGLSLKEQIQIREPFYNGIIHHFVKGRTGEKFNLNEFDLKEKLKEKNIPEGKIEIIKKMASEHLKKIHALGVAVARKSEKRKS